MGKHELENCFSKYYKYNQHDDDNQYNHNHDLGIE
jgi:hypothetical protein